MEKLDIINLGGISSYLGSGICMINKYKFYNTNTLLCYHNTDNAILKFGLDDWNKFIETSQISNYTKVRVIDKLSGIDFISPSGTPYIVGIMKEMNPDLVRTTVVNTIKNTFSIYGINIIFPTPSVWGPGGIYVNDVFKIVVSPFYTIGLDYPNTIFGLCFKLSWDIIQDDVIKKDKLITGTCWKQFLHDTLRNSILLFNEVLPTVTYNDFILTLYNELANELNLEINNRELTLEEVELIAHIEESHSNTNWIENAIHPDFPVL